MIIIPIKNEKLQNENEILIMCVCVENKEKIDLL